MDHVWTGIPRKDQNLIFQPTPRSHTKIILATNIAETSLTIDDVTVVIDSGLAKEKAYDPHTKLSYLKSTFISQVTCCSDVPVLYNILLLSTVRIIVCYVYYRCTMYCTIIVIHYVFDSVCIYVLALRVL